MPGHGSALLQRQRLELHAQIVRRRWVAGGAARERAVSDESPMARRDTETDQQARRKKQKSLSWTHHGSTRRASQQRSTRGPIAAGPDLTQRRQFKSGRLDRSRPPPYPRT